MFVRVVSAAIFAWSVCVSGVQASSIQEAAPAEQLAAEERIAVVGLDQQEGEEQQSGVGRIPRRRHEQNQRHGRKHQQFQRYSKRPTGMCQERPPQDGKARQDYPCTGNIGKGNPGGKHAGKRQAATCSQRKQPRV